MLVFYVYADNIDSCELFSYFEQLSLRLYERVGVALVLSDLCKVISLASFEEDLVERVLCYALWINVRCN